MTRVLILLVLLVCVDASAAPANEIPLDRDPDQYFILALGKARLKNIAIADAACTGGLNVGVNCAGSGSCGLLRASDATVAAPGQLASDRLRATGSYFQVFRNDSVASPPTCAMIGHPGARPDCADDFVTPILGDLDGDSQPSCDETCTADTGDVAAACGVMLPFPACDPGRPVEIVPNYDCSTGDTVLGNGRCDLAPGVYGAINMANGARLDLAPGTTVICSLKARNAVRITSSGPATVLIPDRGAVRINNGADVGGTCGSLRIVSERGLIKLGRHGDYGLDACSVAGKVRLGRGNNLRGHFVGALVLSDFNNDGRCCDPGEPLPTTSTLGSTVPGPGLRGRGGALRVQRHDHPRAAPVRPRQLPARL